MSEERIGMQLNPVVEALPPSGIRRFFDLVANTKGVISLGVGEPDFVTPWRIREACVYSLERGYTMYTSNLGMPDLRKAIVKHLAKQYGVEYSWEKQILITVGASEAVDLAMRTVICPGDEILIPEPCYVSYRPTAAMAGGVPVPVPTYVEDNFQLTAKALAERITERTKMVVLSFPNNPTGAIMTPEEIMAIAELVKKHNLYVLADEIYSELTYEGSHICFANLPGMYQRTILINGFSKCYAMTGWRVGYACAHPDIIALMNKIHQYSMLCAPIQGQMAALEALQSGECEKNRMREEYNQRRQYVVSRFNEMGLKCFEPKGAFYAFPSVKASGMDSDTFCEKLLEEEKVAVVPGSAFGDSGNGFIRVSYASSMNNLIEATNRMERFVNKYRGSKI